MTNGLVSEESRVLENLSLDRQRALHGAHCPGQSISDEQMQQLCLRKHEQDPQWNYTLSPRHQVRARHVISVPERQLVIAVRSNVYERLMIHLLRDGPLRRHGLGGSGAYTRRPVRWRTLQANQWQQL